MENKERIEYVAMGAKPDPFNFSIVKFEIVGGGTIVLANYNGCKTYNGDKLILLKGHHNPTTFKSLDPHFLEGHPVVARFSPTEEGWMLARISAKNLPSVLGEDFITVGTINVYENTTEKTIGRGYTLSCGCGCVNEPTTENRCETVTQTEDQLFNVARQASENYSKMLRKQKFDENNGHVEKDESERPE